MTMMMIKVKAKNCMFQAIKINNYQNLLASKNNRKVTFIRNQFQVSICSSTFSPCISPDKTLRIVLSLSINIVFCISPATCFDKSFLFKHSTTQPLRFSFHLLMLQLSMLSPLSCIQASFLSTRMLIVYTSSAFPTVLLQCFAVGDRPYHKSRSFSTSYLPKLSQVF